MGYLWQLLVVGGSAYFMATTKAMALAIVAEANRPMHELEDGALGESRIMQRQAGGATRRIATDLDVCPFNPLAPNTRAQGFGCGFLGSKAGRQGFNPIIAITKLTGCIDACQKTCAMAPQPGVHVQFQ
ncbi:MAG: hypothetical protein R2867_24500 [Caldilineaceae bacterium]